MSFAERAQKIYSLLDLTSLNDMDSPATIEALCHKAKTTYGHVAAICVYPEFVKQAAQEMSESGSEIATVINFPLGTDNMTIISPVILDALAAGATEIDMVFPYGDYLQGDRVGACDLVRQCKEVLGNKARLKVILETGALDSQEVISAMSHDAIEAGADFLKTSTGKIAVGATLDAAKTMLLAIKQSGKNIGFKASGGIRTLEQADSYVRLAEEIMGDDWVTPDHFRIGASNL